MEVARRRGIPIVVDPKYRQFFEYAGATVFKPNRRELESALGAAVDLQNGTRCPTSSPGSRSTICSSRSGPRAWCWS